MSAGVPLADAFVRIRADGSAFKGDADKMISGAVASANSGAAGVSKAFSKAGDVVALAAVTVAVVSTKMAMDFQEATTKLITGAGESTKNIELVKKGLLDMAPAVGIGPLALAKAMFLVESAGYHGAEGLLVMKAAAEGAKVGGASATTVANGLTTALTDYHLPASKAAEVTSKLVATVAAGKTNMEALSGSLSGVLPFAASFGVKLDDVAGAMATMTAQGITADTASTNLKFTMMSLANETPKGAKALKLVGLSAAEAHDSLGKRGLSGTLELVTEAIGKKFPKGSFEYTKALAAIVGGTRGMGATLALTGTNMATYQKNIKDIGGAAVESGGHVKGWAKTSEDLNTQLDKAKAGLGALAVTLGEKLIPIIQSAIDWTSKHKAIVGFLAETVAVLAVGVVAYSGIMKVAGVVQAIWNAGLVEGTAAQWSLNTALTANPIGAVVVVVLLLAAGIVWVATKTTWFQTIWEYAWSGIQRIFGLVVQAVILGFRFILKVWTTVIGGLLSGAATIAETLHLPFAHAMRKASDAFQGFADKADKKLSDVAESASKWGVKTGDKYAAGITGSKPLVLTAAGVIAQAAQAKLLFNAQPQGAAVGGSYATGISNAMPLVLTAAGRLVQAAQTRLNSLTHLAAPAVAAPGWSKGGTGIFGHNAGGTNNWRGGPTWVNEKGGEIIDLPSGSRIIPADKSAAMLDSSATVDEIRGLRADIRALPKTYQMGQRQMSGAR